MFRVLRNILTFSLTERYLFLPYRLACVEQKLTTNMYIMDGKPF